MNYLSVFCFLLLGSSTCFGQAPKLWTNKSPLLTDYSYAGYHRGEKPIPQAKTSKSVTEFGARPNDQKDDTAAFIKAISSTKQGVLYIPPGRYIITQPLIINKADIVLRGAGMSKTTLYFPKSLTDFKPKPTQNSGGTPTSSYSWSGGFIRFSGKFTSPKLANITTSAKRGSSTLTVNSVDKIQVGEKILIKQQGDEAKTLLNHLYNDQAGDTSKLLGKRASTSLLAKVIKIKGNKVTIDRSLLTDIRPQWKPSINTFNYTVRECGIENLKIEFPNTQYKGHFSEKGYNAIVFGQSINCWIQNIVIKNCDSGIFLGGLCHSVKGLLFESDRKADSRKCTGHHGFSFFGNDCLLEKFNFNTRFIHDITAGAFKSGNVCMSGKGLDLCFDHHKRAPHNNLFTALDVGVGSRIFSSGGGSTLGRNCGAWTTFWGFKSQKPIKPPSPDFAPSELNLIGINIKGKKIKYYVENIDKLQPLNLYKAQLKKRLSQKK